MSLHRFAPIVIGALLATACSPDPSGELGAESGAESGSDPSAGASSDGAAEIVRWTAPPGFEADPAHVPACTAEAGPGEAEAVVPEPEVVATGLEVPWDLAFLPDGRVLVVERRGVIRQIVGGELREEPWATVPVEAVAEAGLLGIAVDPDFGRTGHVYVVATSVDRTLSGRIGRALAGLVGDRDATAWTNRIVRLTDADGRGTEPTVVAAGLDAGPVHAGGGLRFGPDGRLYVGIGEGGVPARASDPESDGGKIHVVDVRGGGAPEVFASGFRNPQGLAFHPSAGRLLVSDHGPTGTPADGYRTGHDELNRVERGASYGWPTVAGRWRGDGVPGRAPLAEWTPSLAAGGLEVVDDPGSAWHGDVLLASLVQGRLVRLSMDSGEARPDSLSVACSTNLYTGRFGRLRAVRQAPDGSIWFTTSNRDQRGVPRDGDDRLLRFVPPAAPAGGSR